MAKILCVDDDVNILAGFQRNLRKHFDTTNALGGPAALKILGEKGPFGVILTDMHMPGMSGLDFLALAHEKSPESVQVMLTGSADMATAVEAANSGRIFRFLMKPCSPDLLVATLAAALDRYELSTCRNKLIDTAGQKPQAELDLLRLKAHASEQQATLLHRAMGVSATSTALIDRLTGLPLPSEAEAALRTIAEAEEGVMAVVFCVKLQHARARFGASIADQIMNFAAQHLANVLKAPWAEQGLFRWHGEAFVVVLPNGMDLAEVQVEAKNLTSQPLSFHFETRTRDAFVPVKIVEAAFREFSVEDLLVRIAEFTRQARDTAA